MPGEPSQLIPEIHPYHGWEMWHVKDTNDWYETHPITGQMPNESDIRKILFDDPVKLALAMIGHGGIQRDRERAWIEYCKYYFQDEVEGGVKISPEAGCPILYTDENGIKKKKTHS